MAKKKSFQNLPKTRVSKRAVVKKKSKAKLELPKKKSRGWAIMGFDTAPSSLAGAAIGYDASLKKLKGPAFILRRWSKEDHYFDRLEMCARSPDLISDLMAELGLFLELNEIYIAQEEPYPLVGKFTQTGQSGFLKQQAEISGAFLGGLLRYGYREIWQMPSLTWRQVVAADLGITIHHTKWKDPKLCERYNCKPADSGKFRAKQWAMEYFSHEIPDWPDIIENSKLGKIPRPENSVAKAVQPDDRYDALAIMWSLGLDLEAQGVIDFGRGRDLTK